MVVHINTKHISMMKKLAKHNVNDYYLYMGSPSQPFIDLPVKYSKIREIKGKYISLETNNILSKEIECMPTVLVNVICEFIDDYHGYFAHRELYN